MIIQALVDYYKRLEEDPKQDVAAYGFSREKISFCVVLTSEGKFHSLEDIRSSDGKRSIPESMVVPDRGGRSGTSFKANFLWDNTGYALGADGKGNPDRTCRAFDAFRELHVEFAKRVNDEGLDAVCKFLANWSPRDATKLPNWEDVCDRNVVFRILNKRGYVHESESLRSSWVEFASAEVKSEPGDSLLTGKREDLAQLHPMIQGVVGAQSTGAALASFNKESFLSYAKDQTYNAPIGIYDVFRYTTSLNRLLADRSRRILLGDTTIVFWSDKPTEMEDFFGSVIADSPSEDQETISRINRFFGLLKQGRAGEQLKDTATRFYVLGLSPNASRLAVRFWMAGTVAQFCDRLTQHLDDLEMDYAYPDAPPISIRRIVMETARPKGDRPDPKTVSPLLAGSITRSILTGAAYPDSLLCAIVTRLRADQRLSHQRAAVLKACIQRRARIMGRRKEIPMSLDEKRSDPAYLMGRLFAAIEKIQEDASDGKLNRTVKDSYFGSAAATPASVFPRLLKLHNHHLNKIDSPGLRVHWEKTLGAITDNLTGFPNNQTLEEQGIFFIGYFHQRQSFFTKKATDSADNGSK